MRVAATKWRQGELCLEPRGFSGLPLSISISNSKAKWKTTATKKGGINEDTDPSAMKVQDTLPGKEC